MNRLEYKNVHFDKKNYIYISLFHRNIFVHIIIYSNKMNMLYINYFMEMN
jgi:hypothetical protein